MLRKRERERERERERGGGQESGSHFLRVYFVSQNRPGIAVNHLALHACLSCCGCCLHTSCRRVAHSKVGLDVWENFSRIVPPSLNSTPERGPQSGRATVRKLQDWHSSAGAEGTSSRLGHLVYRLDLLSEREGPHWPLVLMSVRGQLTTFSSDEDAGTYSCSCSVARNTQVTRHSKSWSFGAKFMTRHYS